MTPRPCLLKVALLALLLALGACGGEDPAERVAAARQATLDAGSAEFSLDQQITGGPGGEQTVTSTGVLAFTEQRGRVVTDVPDGGAGPQTFETIFTDGTVFVRLPDDLAPTPWIRIDLDDAEGLPGLEQLSQYSSDPSQNLWLLEGVTGDIERVGEEEVRGAQATHYRLTVDLERAVAEAPEQDRGALRQQADLLGVTELPLDLWLDGDDRVVRQAFVVDLANVDAGTGPIEGQAATTIEFFGFGAEVDAEPPPDDQVTGFREFLEGSLQPSESGG